MSELGGLALRVGVCGSFAGAGCGGGRVGRALRRFVGVTEKACLRKDESQSNNVVILRTKYNNVVILRAKFVRTND